MEIYTSQKDMQKSIMYEVQCSLMVRSLIHYYKSPMELSSKFITGMIYSLGFSQMKRY